MRVVDFGYGTATARDSDFAVSAVQTFDAAESGLEAEIGYSVLSQ